MPSPDDDDRGKTWKCPPHGSILRFEPPEEPAAPEPPKPSHERKGVDRAPLPSEEML